MAEDPQSIAERLIAEHGPAGALAAVRSAIEDAHARGDNYRLSVWREVRVAVRTFDRIAQSMPPDSSTRT